MKKSTSSVTLAEFQVLSSRGQWTAQSWRAIVDLKSGGAESGAEEGEEPRLSLQILTELRLIFRKQDWMHNCDLKRYHWIWLKIVSNCICRKNEPVEYLQEGLVKPWKYTKYDLSIFFSFPLLSKNIYICINGQWGVTDSFKAGE